MTADSNPQKFFLPPVFLIGFMGCGKTTLGEALPARIRESWGIETLFSDLDKEIEKCHGMSVSNLFATKGEKYFRNRETETLKCLGANQNMIIACGGGTPCHSGNMDWMNRHGLTVWLNASPAALHRRLCEAQNQRPLLNGLDAGGIGRIIESKSAERQPFYKQALLVLDSDRLESESEIHETATALLRMLQPFIVKPELITES